ncbi:MAG: Serine protease AprX [Actinomycetia bacterium]|nr:Serine protease AprX [Actinomycetes bacterium]
MDGSHSHRRLVAAAILAAVPVALMPTAAGAVARSRPIGVVVRATAGNVSPAETLVEDLGGNITLHLGIIGGFAADVPADALPSLAASPVVQAVTTDASVHMDSLLPSLTPNADDPMQQLGSPYAIAQNINAGDLWQRGVTGRGIDVALLDTGIAPVTGLTGQYVNGPDLSFDALGPDTAGVDAYGHGTAMASLIAGRDPNLPVGLGGLGGLDSQNAKRFTGIAPGARLVNVKVGAADGATDVSQVIAGIDWVVQHAHDGGRNIRILNLSFGTDGVQDYVADPLTYAAEAAWRKGIVVVVSAGNTGFGTAKLDDPAYDPYVMAVGASDNKGTRSPSDDVIANFSSRGDISRRPDFMAPGVGVVGLRAPGSTLDQQYPLARQGDRYFRGSGTSQATAVVSGAAALLLQQYPQLTPDQVKDAFTTSGRQLRTDKGVLLDQGARSIDVNGAADDARDLLRSANPAAQSWPLANGLGSIDASRGSYHLVDSNGAVLSGEVDIFGNVWDGSTWSAASWNGSTWTGDLWLGNTWSGSTWTGSTWLGRSWSGRSWSGRSWSGSSWSGNEWG